MEKINKEVKSGRRTDDQDFKNLKRENYMVEDRAFALARKGTASEIDSLIKDHHYALKYRFPREGGWTIAHEIAQYGTENQRSLLKSDADIISLKTDSGISVGRIIETFEHIII